MTDLEYKRFYARLYRLFDNATPLKTDCGVLCKKACCKGDENTGMLLFPGEETTLKVKEADGRRYAVCGGNCSRSERPLSCRIFPFAPVQYPDGRPAVTVDPRGFNICPLVRQADSVAFSPLFIRRMRVVSKLLSKDEACRDFIAEITGEITDILTLNDKLRG